MSDLQRKDLSPAWKATKPFLNGGLSGMAATCIIQPIDMVKVRIQIGAQGGPVSVPVTFPSTPASAVQTLPCSCKGLLCPVLQQHLSLAFCANARLFAFCCRLQGPVPFKQGSLTSLVLLQLQVAKDIIAKDGAGGLYKGLSAGLLRQATYTTARLGIFQIFTDLLKQQNQGKVCLSIDNFSGCAYKLLPKICFILAQASSVLAADAKAFGTASQHETQPHCRSQRHKFLHYQWESAPGLSLAVFD